MQIATARVLLRPWRTTDLRPFRELNADPEVMRFFPSLLSAEQSDALASSMQARMSAQGFGTWVLELPGTAQFAGFVGLNVPAFDNSLVEVAWRLHHAFWGRGFATEAAAAALETGFSRFGLAEICSFTALVNNRSEKVMQRLGMEHRTEDDFNHPALPSGHPLCRHVFYRMTAKHWAEQKSRFPFLATLRIFP